MSNPTIKLNPSKPCELEFDVTVQGLEDSAKPEVRFVLSGSHGFDCLFSCDQNDDGKWAAKIPALPFLRDNSAKFRVEVIVDGYYFEPAMGVAYLVTDPSVKFQPISSKPTVTTSFTVKQDDEPKAEEDEQVTAQYAGDKSPTTDLLKPEFEPMQGSVKTAQATKDDEHIDHSRIDDISSHVTPGETTDPEPQHGNNKNDEDEGDEEDFNPKRVAEAIVKNTFKGVQKPETRGTLFKRDGDGKPVVEGLDSPAKKAQKIASAAKVKQILNTK